MDTRNIIIKPTEIDDIEQIIVVEKLNSDFVGQYSFDRHKNVILDPNDLHLSIFDSFDNKLIGYAILSGLNDSNNSIEFRRIAISQKGLGFGREAIRIIKSICFNKYKAHRLWLDVYSDNFVAIKLYESEGFKREGLLRDCIKEQDFYRSMLIMSIIESDL